VGIGIENISSSAIFEVASDSFGILIPRLDSQTISQINDPAESLLVYQTDGRKGFKFYNGINWLSMIDDLGVEYHAINTNTISKDSIKSYLDSVSNNLDVFTFFYYGPIENPDELWFWNKLQLIKIYENKLHKFLKIYDNYNFFRQDSTATSELIYIKDFYKIIGLDTFKTIGGFFQKCLDSLEDGGLNLLNKNGLGYCRIWDQININPDWWEVGGYDYEGKKYQNNNMRDGIQCDFDRVFSAIQLAGKYGKNVSLPNGRTYIQKNRVQTLIKKNTTIYGNKCIIKRGEILSQLSESALVGQIQVQVINASNFRIGMSVAIFSGPAAGQNERINPAQDNIITSINNNTITLGLALEKNMPSGSIIQCTEDQFGYGNNVTINDVIFDGNKNVMFGTESWNFVNCLRSTLSLGLRVNNCEFYNMPSDCITTGGEAWISNCIIKNLNGPFLHGSSGITSVYSQMGVFIDRCKADSVCISLPEVNGHASQHGFYSQSIGTHGIKIVNCRITNVLNGGIVSPLVMQSDEFSLINNYFENCSHVLTNVDTDSIIDINISRNTIKKCGLNRLGDDIFTLDTYMNFNFSNNYIENTLFHFAGVSYFNCSDNTFILKQNEGHTSFLNTELEQESNYFAVLVVAGKGVKVSNNVFKAEYQDSLAYTAIRFNVGSENNLILGLSISGNKIYNFSNGITSSEGSITEERKGIIIDNNYILVKDSFIYGDGIGILSYYNSRILNNQIENNNNTPSIKIYGNLQDTLYNLGCIVKGNLITGNNFSNSIDVYYWNNVIEDNLLEGGIGFQNLEYRQKNILGINRQINRTTRSIMTF